MQRRSADHLPLSDWCWPASAGLGNCLGVDPVLVPLIIVALVYPALALLAHIIIWIVIALRHRPTSPNRLPRTRIHASAVVVAAQIGVGIVGGSFRRCHGSTVAARATHALTTGRASCLPHVVEGAIRLHYPHVTRMGPGRALHWQDDWRPAPPQPVLRCRPGRPVTGR